MQVGKSYMFEQRCTAAGVHATVRLRCAARRQLLWQLGRGWMQSRGPLEVEVLQPGQGSA